MNSELERFHFKFALQRASDELIYKTYYAHRSSKYLEVDMNARWCLWLLASLAFVPSTSAACNNGSDVCLTPAGQALIGVGIALGCLIPFAMYSYSRSRARKRSKETVSEEGGIEMPARLHRDDLPREHVADIQLPPPAYSAHDNDDPNVMN